MASKVSMEDIDLELQGIVEQMRVKNLFGVDHLSNLKLSDIPNIRKAYERSIESMMAARSLHPNVICEERFIPSPSGTPELRVKVYRPANQAEALPCFYHIHGGGFILGSIDGEEGYMSVLAEKLNCLVVSVDYRLAPEHPYPAQVEDCYAGLVWLHEHAAELKLDPSRIVVGGESAGGGLAAATALLARDRGGPSVCFQYLVYPMLDDRNTTESSRAMTGNWPGWSREMNELGWRAMLGELTGTEQVTPYAAPARANDLSNLPPAYLEVGSLDLFRDEIIDYAGRLLQAGVSVELHVIPGVFHAWEIAAPTAKVSKRAAALRKDALLYGLHQG